MPKVTFGEAKGMMFVSIFHYWKPLDWFGFKSKNLLIAADDFGAACTGSAEQQIQAIVKEAENEESNERVYV